MGRSWSDVLSDNLALAKQRHLLRDLQPAHVDGCMIHVAGQKLVNLSSNDYLGLAQHPRLCQATRDAIAKFGVGSSASRLVGGSHPLHHLAQARFAALKHAQAALLCPTGYQANHAAITALVMPGDLICMDKRNHASLIDAAKASGAALRIFGHLQYDKLERLLARLTPSLGKDTQACRPTRCFIITDSVFSMDGDVADLPRICHLAKQYDAIVIVDEAHGTGVLGQTGAGLCQAQGISDQVDVVISTASKALGCLGGIITGKQGVIDTIINSARSFIYTTAAMPMQGAGILAALDVMADEPQRRQRLADLSRCLREQLSQMGLLGQPTLSALHEVGPPVNPPDLPPANPPATSPVTPPTTPIVTPIVPVIVGSAQRALALAAYLKDKGFFAPAIRPPTVANNQARVRISLRCDLSDTHIQRLVDALQQWSMANPLG